MAIDGRIDLRDDYQEGRAGEEKYTVHTRREQGLLRQSFQLFPTIGMDARFQLIDENSDSRTDAGETSFRTLTYQPGVTSSYRSGWVRIGFNGNGYRREQEGDQFAGSTIERLDYSGWVTMMGLGDSDLTGRWKKTYSWRQEGDEAEQEVQERNGSIDASHAAGKAGKLRYRFTDLENKAVTRSMRTSHSSHMIEYTNNLRFFNDRLDVYVRGRTEFFRQKIVNENVAEQPILLLPLDGGFLLDDTPEVLDPLEGGATAVPALHDRDLLGPTPINIGDNGEAVREFGGDYRNIVYDFGDGTAIDSAYLYIDRTILVPAMFEWRVFVTDDPEGRSWEELGASNFATVYREWGTGTQGWEINFSEPLSTRFFKLVDVKIGPTVPDLYVTELEVYTFGEAEVTTIDRIRTDRTNGSVGYRIAQGLNVRYDINYREREFSEEERDLLERSHGAQAGLQRWGFLLSGRHEIHNLVSATKRNSDVATSSVSLRHGKQTAFSSSAGWSRSKDRSFTLDKVTDSYSLGFIWMIAPALRLSQKINHGRLDDSAEETRSRSYSATTNIQSRPVPSLTIDILRTDRWVNQEASSGFVRFNNTNSSVRWSPVPQVTLRSDVRYKVREESSWTAQNFLSWQIIPGGQLQPSLTVNHFRDTRSDLSQVGAGFMLVWRASRNLFAEGNIETQKHTTRGAVNTPWTGGVRVTLTF